MASDRSSSTSPEAGSRGFALSSRWVLWAGALLGLLVAAAVLWLGSLQYREEFAVERSRGELLARVLEDHATRTVETAAIAMGSMAEVLAERQEGVDAAEIGHLLNQCLVGLPFLRSLAVVDASGRVLTSTDARDRGAAISMARLGPLPAAGRDSLGSWVAGRGLIDLAPKSRGQAVPMAVGFIPLLRSVPLRSGRPLLLVALLNPDTFSNHQALTVADEASGVLLANYSGELLASTAAIATAPGSRITAHPVFHDLLPQREHGSYVGQGARTEPQVVAFRVSRSRPLVVLVEYPQSAVRARWWLGMRSFVVAAAAVLLFLAAMSLMAWRSLRARETTRTLLDAAQAEMALRARELAVTIRSVQELIFRTNARGTITFVNERWSSVSGTAAPAAVGRLLFDLVLPEQRATVRRLFADDGEAVRTTHATLRDGAGVLRHFDVAVVPLFERGRIIGFAGSAADVTERVVAQQKLQTQLAVSALMLESSPLPLSMADASGRCLSLNRAWEDFTGLRREEILGRPMAQCLRSDDAALHEAQDRALLASGGKMRHDARVRHADGSTRDVILSKVTLPGDDGAPAGILCVLMDVSEFRAAERATREARDAAEETSRSKTEFIANISHELRTPLQSILGFSELGMLRGKADDPRSAMFADIHTAGQRMLALVNDLLDVSKIESSVGTLHLERCDLRPLVREVAHELKPLLEARELRLDLQLSDVPLLAKVDPLRLQQVLRNVLANAIKFSPLQGRISLLGELTPEGEIGISVADQGPGIPPKELERVFEAFVQSSRTKDGAGGTGLGLAICRKILQGLGGHIHAENRPGGGTVFYIGLPARASLETAPMPL